MGLFALSMAIIDEISKTIHSILVIHCFGLFL